jgi:archaemetzincin
MNARATHGSIGIRFWLAALAALAALGCGRSPEREVKPAQPSPGEDPVSEKSDPEQLIEKLRPLHRPLEPPRPGDWLAEHDEPGQTFAQYRRSSPVTARGKRKVIYIQPIGEFTAPQRRIVGLTADFMGRYFGLQTRTLPDIEVGEDWPAHAVRKHPSWGDEQLLTTHILDRVLEPALPDDAATLLGFTAWDLWPGRGWNFVFGQASLRERVGVWSIYRNGDPAGDDGERRLCLLRTIKTATHETGHMFSMQHCTAYDCNMCGSNHREEADRRTLALCPECLAKLVLATGVDPIARFASLAAFARAHGLDDEAAFYERSRAALAGRSSGD